MSNFFCEINAQACQELFENILKNEKKNFSKLVEKTFNNINRNYEDDSTLKDKKLFQCRSKLELEEYEEEEEQSFNLFNLNNNIKNINFFNESTKVKDWDEVCSSTSSFDENNQLDTNLTHLSVSPSLSTATTTTTVSSKTLTKDKRGLKDLETISLAASPFHATALLQEIDDNDHDLNSSLYPINLIETESTTNVNKNKPITKNSNLTTPAATIKEINKSQFSKAGTTIKESVDSTKMFSTIQRHSNLLQLLPYLRMFNESVLVDLFFNGLIGNMTIDTVIPFIYSMDVLQIFDKSTLSELVTETNLSTKQEIIN